MRMAKVNPLLHPLLTHILNVPLAHLVATLSLVQQKLARLQIENNSSRYRMRELELELESCKQDVARERQNVIQQEEIIARHRVLTKSARKDEENQKRYRDAVEEKKGAFSIKFRRCMMLKT